MLDETIVSLVSLTVMVLWTARLAWTRGLNPWFWSGASALLLLIPGWNILGMIPMMALLFWRRGRARGPLEDTADDQSEAQSITFCPKCRALQTIGHRYCDRCGWEMDQPEESMTSEAAPDAPKLEGMATSERQPEPVPPESILAERDIEAPTDEATADAPDRELPQPLPTPDLAAPPAAVPPAAVPAAPPAPPAVTERVFRGPPTPASMTERGIELLREGKYQQAVDQFTKAIALDPNYRLALEHRAEAYSHLGRNQRAAEDRRQLEAI